MEAVLESKLRFSLSDAKGPDYQEPVSIMELTS